jgi:hypothetical protein
LARLPGVKAVYNDELNHPDTFQSPQYIGTTPCSSSWRRRTRISTSRSPPPVLHLPARGDATLYITIGPGGMREGDFRHAWIVLKDPAGVRVATLPVTAVMPS